MKMQKKKFRIGTLSKKLDLAKFVIRFWEREFNIKSIRSMGKQRYYTEQDMEQFKMIKQLLYEKKFTIAGAKSMLQKQIPVPMTIPDATVCEAKQIQIEDLLHIRSKLCKLQKLL
jgi:DNA-binding transcriptional MerR regulator